MKGKYVLIGRDWHQALPFSSTTQFLLLRWTTFCISLSNCYKCKLTIFLLKCTTLPSLENKTCVLPSLSNKTCFSTESVECSTYTVPLRPGLPYLVAQTSSVSSVLIAQGYLRSNAQNRPPFHHLPVRDDHCPVAGWRFGRIVSLQPDKDIQKLLSNGNRISETLLSIFRGFRLWEKVAHGTIIHLLSSEAYFQPSAPWRTSVVLSGKLFRIKTRLWPKPTSVNLLCKFKSSQLVYSLQPLKVLPSSAYHLGMPYKRWAMLFFMPPWPSRTWVRITCIFSTRVYTLMCTRSCSACRLHPSAIRLGRTQLSSGH